MPFGFPRFTIKPLLPPDKRHHFDGNIRHVLTNIRNIVFTCLRVEQMRALRDVLPRGAVRSIRPESQRLQRQACDPARQEIVT